MNLLIYGAYGYTGRLITEEAVRKGLTPTLAGRDAGALGAVADRFGCPDLPVALPDGPALREALRPADAVLHCAGPFARTARPMVEACLETGTHYLDITGEIGVFEALAGRDAQAADRGITLLPGVGFDVVPTDCLATHLHEQVDAPATALEIAFLGQGGISAGTLKTAVGQLGRGGLVRRQGTLRSVPPGWTTRTVDFGDHPRTVISIPWGDLATAARSTGIPNITTYTYMPRWARRLLRGSRYLQPLLGWAPVQAALQRLVERWAPTPTSKDRRRGETKVWTALRTAEGTAHEARLRGPEAYTFTARAAVGAAQRVVEADGPVGYQTPATALGASFAGSIEGVSMEM